MKNETMPNLCSFLNFHKETLLFEPFGLSSMVYCILHLLPFPLLCINFSFQLWVSVFCASFGSILSRVGIIIPLRLCKEITSTTPRVRASQSIQSEVNVWKRPWLLAQVTVGKVIHNCIFIKCPKLILLKFT